MPSHADRVRKNYQDSDVQKPKAVTVPERIVPVPVAAPREKAS
jgi:hypothetical protein